MVRTLPGREARKQALDFAADLAAIGWSQQQLADKIGVHRNTVSAWATGKRELPGPVIAYLTLVRRVADLMRH